MSAVTSPDQALEADAPHGAGAPTRRGIPRVLSIAGTDPTGGAGIHADLKSIAAHGGYGMAAVTALVAQNTRGVRAVHTPPAGFLAAQLRAVSDDVEIDAVKIGMLQSVEIVDVVRDWLDDVRPPVVVLDPVVVATSGDRLLDPDAEAAVLALCAAADLVTPNIHELAVLTGSAPAAAWDDALGQARALASATGAAVLLKGGHLDGDECRDAIVDADGVHAFTAPRVRTRHTHGTGCSLSSAVATLRAAGIAWPDALAVAKQWLTGAIAAADRLAVGGGSGPVDHFHALRPRGGWSQAVWAGTAHVRAAVDDCPFVRGLGDGTLPGDAFAWYLAQDALYLRDYARLLEAAARLAPTDDERSFWSASADGARAEAENLHLVRLGAVDAHPSPTTRAYLAHLDRATASYAELVAALLPCFWLYTDLGERLAVLRTGDHPYGDWLDAYGDPAFAASTERARQIVDAAAVAASDDERARMRHAFVEAMQHELAFFEAPLRAAGVTAAR